MEAVLGVLADYTLVPLLNQLNYLFYYHTNVEEVEKKLITLRTTKTNVEIFVSQKGDGYDTRENVQVWLKNVENELDMAQEGRSSCFNCIRRYKVSRKAKKRTENIVDLINEGKEFNEDNIGHRVPSSETKSITLPEDYQIIETRSSMAKKIMDALKDPGVNKVGICGMGGVGKTELLKQVEKLVFENKLFDRVIPPVDVGKSKNIFQIQEDIKKWLNIDLDMEFEMKRASMLRNKIKGMKENILFMLDDLWTAFDIENKIGIPIHSKEGCKIVMTSRSQSLLKNKMNVKLLFEMGSLSEAESWNFFEAIVGNIAEDDIREVAVEVVKKCGGLPLALKILAQRLKGERVQVWRDAFYILKNPDKVDISGVTDELYACLKLSYDSLLDEAKSILLLCSVFPDDYQIDVEDLKSYVMGLELLKDRNTWRDARNRVTKLVDELTSSNLLLVSSEYSDQVVDYVKMHDVVHDFAKYTASKTHNMHSLTYGKGQHEWREEDTRGSYNAIYIDHYKNFNLPSKLDFPCIQLFILKSNGIKGHETPNGFFDQMEKLKVLDIERMVSEPSSRKLSTFSLNNLRTLIMSRCRTGYNIDTIGELKKLIILKIYYINEMKEIPKSLRELTQLKVLHISCCFYLTVIPPNIISSMTKLEELELQRNISLSWKTNAKRLSELNCLTRLSTLRIDVDNIDSLINELNSEKVEELEEFCINCGGHVWKGDSSMLIHYIFMVPQTSYRPIANTLELYMNSIFYPNTISEGFQKLLQKCEECFIYDVDNTFAKLLFNPNQNYSYHHLKQLLVNSDSLPQNGNVTPFFNHQVSFPKMECFKILNENNSETLWPNEGRLSSANSFCKLQTINIIRCNKLRYVFPVRMVESLVLLIKLEVSGCDSIERIFGIEEGECIDVKIESSLRSLRLSTLPKLVSFYSGKYMLSFPSLIKLKISDCYEMKTFSNGIVTTPKLQHININGRESPVQNNLNFLIQTLTSGDGQQTR